MSIQSYIAYYFPYIQNKYVFSLTILVFYLILSKLILFIFNRYFRKLAKKTKTDIDDEILAKTENPISYVLVFVGIKLALVPLNLKGSVGIFLENITTSLIIITVIYMIIKIIDIFIDVWGSEWARRTKSDIDQDVLPLIHKFSKVLISIFGLIYILRAWGVEIGPFLASLGIAGIAIGFAVKDSLANIFGGVSLILDKSVKVGDAIRLDSGESGKILEVGLRSTKVRTWDNEVMIIPNGVLANAKITNFAQPDLSARQVTKFGVEYGSDPEKVKKTALKVVVDIKEIVKQPEPFVRFSEMADFSLKFKLYFWVAEYGQRFMVEDIVVTNLYKALKKAGIGIPFPTRTVYLHKKRR